MITKEQAIEIAQKNFKDIPLAKTGFYKYIEFAFIYNDSYMFRIKRNTNGGHYGPSLYCSVSFNGTFEQIKDVEKLHELTHYHCMLISNA